MEKNTEAEQEHENREEEEDEALSLRDLPNKPDNQFKKESPESVCNGDEAIRDVDFDFCSMKESEMCVADELFFQGQILPLRRHSVSADSASAGLRSFSSMERCRSAGYTSASSRSSSTRSHQSSSSATTSSTAAAAAQGKHPRTTWNRFQFSHPSPTPQIRFSKVSHPNNYTRNSTLWSLFRVGLVTMPETGSQSFRIRNRDPDGNHRNKLVRGGSSGVMSKKLKQRFVNKNLVFFDTCKCSINSVETKTIPLKSEAEKKNNSKKDQIAAGKQSISRTRTFEWLKQLSLEDEGPTTD